jgi:hypothetical protein
MTRLISSNLPIYFQCLRVPTEWTRAIATNALARYAHLMNSSKEESHGDLLQVHRAPGVATTFDPWEMRNKFFRLKPGDSEALISFLQTAGLFEAAGRTFLGKEPNAEKRAITTTNDGQFETRYLEKMSEEHIWGLQRLLNGALRNLAGHTGKYSDFQVQIVHAKGGPKVILTTTTFLDSLLLTLAVDKVQGAKVRKCARPDCGVLFSTTGGHKRKYCQWYCGHIQSVRKQRKVQQTKRPQKKTSQTSTLPKGK